MWRVGAKSDLERCYPKHLWKFPIITPPIADSWSCPNGIKQKAVEHTSCQIELAFLNGGCARSEPIRSAAGWHVTDARVVFDRAATHDQSSPGGQLDAPPAARSGRDARYCVRLWTACEATLCQALYGIYPLFLRIDFGLREIITIFNEIRKI